MTIEPVELERLSKAAEQEDDDVRYYGGPTSTHRPARDAYHAALVQHHRTGQLVPAQPSGDVVEAVAELQLAAFLAGRGSVTGMKHGTRTAKPAPTMDEFRQMARTALDAHRGKQ